MYQLFADPVIRACHVVRIFAGPVTRACHVVRIFAGPVTRACHVVRIFAGPVTPCLSRGPGLKKIFICCFNFYIHQTP
jgi:hypothetical protein